MKYFIGTSGWAYKSWNPDGLSWYVENSGMSAIELNASFYRFPAIATVERWQEMAPRLKWAIKVNRSITHFYQFEPSAFAYWQRFHKLFRPLDKQIAFYLFQLPPSMTPIHRLYIENFFKKTKLGARFALECRHKDWWQQENLRWAQNLGLTLVSVDAPLLPNVILNTSDNIYLRLHGHEKWYTYDYSNAQIKNIAMRIKQSQAKKAFIFLNNDESMLKNALIMKKFLNNRHTTL